MTVSTEQMDRAKDPSGDQTPVGPVDVGKLIDEMPYRWPALITTLLMGLVILVDGFDLVVIGFIAPALSEAFRASRGAIGLVIMLSLVGIAVGGLLGGWLGDRFGRRPLIFASVALFGLASGVAGVAPDLMQFTVWRFISGIGLGALMPNATSLIAEIVPLRWRSQSIIAATVGQSLGGVLCGMVAEALLGSHGWRVMLYLGAILPLALLPLLFVLTPESPRFLALNPGRSKQLANLLNRLCGGSVYSAAQTFGLPGERPSKRGDVRALFARGLVGDTLSLWAVFFTNLFCMVGLAYWLPIVLTAGGVEKAVALRSLTIYVATGFIGAIASGYLIPRFGSRRTLTSAAVLAGAAAAGLALSLHGAAAPSPLLVMAYAATAGILINTIHLGCYAVQPRVYPTEIRATGSGWAAGAGRVGGILSSFVGVILTQLSSPGFFGVLAVSSLLTAVSLLCLRRHVPAASGRSPAG